MAESGFRAVTALCVSKGKNVPSSLAVSETWRPRLLVSSRGWLAQRSELLPAFLPLGRNGIVEPLDRVGKALLGGNGIQDSKVQQCKSVCLDTP